MSILTFSPVPYTRSRPNHAVLASAKSLLGRLAQAWGTWQAERAMARLGDDALHDMGLVRSEIGRAVRDGRPRR